MNPGGCECGGKVLNRSGAVSSCSNTKNFESRRLPRKKNIFILDHDILSVVVNNNGICGRCGYKKRNCGDVRGVFSALKHRDFTVELCYFRLHESTVCGIYFRSIFELTSNLQNTPIYRRKYDTGRLVVLASEFKRNIRLGNKALRVFCRNIDLGDDAGSMKEIYCCKTCETPLTTSDCKQLGI